MLVRKRHERYTRRTETENEEIVVEEREETKSKIEQKSGQFNQETSSTTYRNIYIRKTDC